MAAPTSPNHDATLARLDELYRSWLLQPRPAPPTQQRPAPNRPATEARDDAPAEPVAVDDA